MTVYGELFIMVNFCANCLCLWAGGRLSRLGPPPGKRFVLSAALGVLYGLIAFAPTLSILKCILFVLLCSYFMVWGTYPRAAFTVRLQAAAYTFFAGLWLAGCGAFLWSQSLSPMLSLVISGVALLLSEFFLKHPTPITASVTQLEITHQGNATRIPCMLDSGNLLTDPVTALPVIVCSRRSLLPVFPFQAPATWDDHLLPGFRFLSVRTAAGRSMMMCFRPEKIRLMINGQWHWVNGVIAIAPISYQGTQALVPSALLPVAAPSLPAIPANMEG